jgi:hypothetical protein
MEAPLVSFELKDKYLLVVGHGKRDNLMAMSEAASLIFAEIERTQCRFLLLDYRKIEVNVQMGDAFNIVRRYEKLPPILRETIIAAVFEGDGRNFGRYWTEVSRQRGFFIEAFEDFDKAEAWLLDQMVK